MCVSTPVRYEQSERVFAELLTKVDSLPLVRGSSGQIEKELRAVNAKLEEQRQRLQKHKHAAEQFDESPTIYGLIAASEKFIRDLTSARDKLETELATDRIIDREDFLANLDLVTYEGRARANALMKRLGIMVSISGGVDAVYIASKGMRELRISLSDDMVTDGITHATLEQPSKFLQLVSTKEGKIVAIPLNEDQRQKFKELDKGGTDSDNLDDYLYRKIGIGTKAAAARRRARAEDQ